MSITHSSDIVVNLAPGGIFGSPEGLGVHRLRFSVQYRTPARKELFTARNFRALVTVSDAHLGIAWPECAWIVRTGQFASDAALLFDLDLTSEQIVRIEALRSRGDLVFKLRFLCEVEHGDVVVQGTDEIRFHVNRSSWITCMTQFGLDRLILLEVDLPLEGGQLEVAVSLLKRAREELNAGNYDGVVQKCRLAIDSLQTALKLQAPTQIALDMFARGSERKRMTKRQRALVATEAARHYAHPALHVDADGETFDYGRRDAAFMLALTSAVVANCLDDRDSRGS